MTNRKRVGKNGIQISTHILTRRMTEVEALCELLNIISTHILTRRMTTIQVSNPLQLFYFNSHPHEEDDTDRAIIQLYHTISTHILTRRMTAILNKNNPFKITYYINNKHFISIVDIFFHFHIYFQA